MDDSSYVEIIGFKSFTGLWNEACDQISKESLASNIDNDLKLFCLLRSMVLSSEKPTFVRSYKLHDLNIPINNNRTYFDFPTKNRIHVSWNHISQPNASYRNIQHRNPKIIKPKPAPVSFLRVGSSKLVEYKNILKIQNDCVFEQQNLSLPTEILYTIYNEEFSATLDKTRVFYPISREIVNMFATNRRHNINLKTFQELTDDMYKKLLAQRNKMK